MAQISVAEAAGRLGVNVQRIHQRIADGSLLAVRVGHQWVIEDADLVRLDSRRPGRPLSARSAWAVVAMASVDAAPGSDLAVSKISPPERSRARRRLRELVAQALRPVDELAVAELVADLRGLLRNRAERRLWHVSARDLADLRSDGRLVLSGVSLAGSGLASGDIVEGYVADLDVDRLSRDFLMSQARHADANVVLHVVDPSVVPGGRVEADSWILMAVDLAEHHRPREAARAVELVRSFAEKSVALEDRGRR